MLVLISEIVCAVFVAVRRDFLIVRAGMKRSLIVMILCLFSLTARARPGLGVSFKGGANAARHAEESRFNRYGISGGIAGQLQWGLSERFALGGQLDLLYSPRGAKIISLDEYLGQIREHYLDLAVAARPEAKLDPVSVYLLLGGELNVLMSANQENAVGAKQDITDALRRIDVTLLIGAGAALHLSGPTLGPFRLNTIFLEARYERGLIDTIVGSDGFQNRTASLMLGLSFALGNGASNTKSAFPPVRSDPQ
ncbi:MAG TPA: porin family protein [Kofleriaceae bacterium]|nr:porin family protein [Kofleriaceae bacterium]